MDVYEATCILQDADQEFVRFREESRFWIQRVRFHMGERCVYNEYIMIANYIIVMCIDLLFYYVDRELFPNPPTPFGR